jgi:hypothetical protein
MINTANQEPIRVWAETPGWPDILLPYSQLEEVRALLDRHGIRYEVEDEVISLDGGPEMATINLAHGTDPSAVQAILDANR